MYKVHIYFDSFIVEVYVHFIQLVYFLTMQMCHHKYYLSIHIIF